MIAISNSRYMPMRQGYITLQDNDGIYYYINRVLYEEAVILRDRFSEREDELVELIGGNNEHTCIETFVEQAPSSLKMLGYFLALLQEDIVGDYEDIVGALDTITSCINPRAFIKQPETVRQSVRFGLSVREEYTYAWDMFFDFCYEYDYLISALRGNKFEAPQRSIINTAPVEDEEEGDEDPWASVLEALEDDEEEEPEEELKGGSGLDLIKQRRRAR